LEENGDVNARSVGMTGAAGGVGVKSAMKRLLGCMVVLSVVAVFAQATWATPVLDQESPVGSGANMELSPGISIQQGGIAGMAGLLTSIEVYVYEPNTAIVSFNLGSPWQTDVSEFITLIDPTAAGWFAIDTSAAGIYLNANDPFVIGFDSGVGNIQFGITATEPGGDYPRGEFWGNGEAISMLDMTFRTYVDPDGGIPAVPAPAALLLAALGTGLVARFRESQSR
jgi:hypothetical protein